MAGARQPMLPVQPRHFRLGVQDAGPHTSPGHHRSDQDASFGGCYAAENYMTHQEVNGGWNAPSTNIYIYQSSPSSGNIASAPPLAAPTYHVRDIEASAAPAMPLVVRSNETLEKRKMSEDSGAAPKKKGRPPKDPSAPRSARKTYPSTYSKIKDANEGLKTSIDKLLNQSTRLVNDLKEYKKKAEKLPGLYDENANLKAALDDSDEVIGELKAENGRLSEGLANARKKLRDTEKAFYLVKQGQNMAIEENKELRSKLQQFKKEEEDVEVPMASPTPETGLATPPASSLPPSVPTESFAAQFDAPHYQPQVKSEPAEEDLEYLFTDAGGDDYTD